MVEEEMMKVEEEEEGGKRGLRKDRVGCTTPAEEEAGEGEGIVNIDNNNSTKTRNTMVWTPRQSTSYHP